MISLQSGFSLQGCPMGLPEHTAAVQSRVGGGDLEPGTYMYPTSLYNIVYTSQCFQSVKIP